MGSGGCWGTLFSAVVTFPSIRGSGRAAAARSARHTSVEAQTQTISRIAMKQDRAFGVPRNRVQQSGRPPGTLDLESNHGGSVPPGNVFAGVARIQPGPGQKQA